MSAIRMAFRVTTTREFRGSVDAVILGYPENPGQLTCYSHIGQHGTCSREWYRTATRNATKDERRALLRELQRIYGPIRVLKRLPRRAWMGHQ